MPTVVYYTLDDIIMLSVGSSEIAYEHSRDASITYRPNWSATSQTCDSRELWVPSTVRLQRTALCERVGEYDQQLSKQNIEYERQVGNCHRSQI